MDTFDSILNNLVTQLPHRNCVLIPDYTRLSTPRLYEHIKSLPASVDAVALHIYDPWNPSADLLKWLQKQPRHFYFFTLEYSNQHIADNVTKLAINHSFFVNARSPWQDLSGRRAHAFSCLNNKASFHRLLLGVRLWNSGFLSDMIYTQNVEEINLLTSAQRRMIHSHDNIGPDRFWERLPLVDGEYVDQDYTINHRAYSQCHCNIATETTVISSPVISEKTYKPLLACQVPIWFANPGHLAYLESLGVNCMRDLLPNDFDLVDIDRKIDYIIAVVRLGGEFMQDFYASHIREIRHNHELVNSDKIGLTTQQQAQEFLRNNPPVSLN